jgi:hypothetical protein
MRKDDRLRRSELFLPPPSINKHRPIPSDEALEEKAMVGFIGMIFFAFIVGFMLTSILFGTGAWFVFKLLEPTQMFGWDVSWTNCVLVAGIIVFCRSWAKALSKEKP